MTDEGPGVPVESREKIFEKYARLDRDAANSAPGSRGLGLAFCRLAVEAHGGKIWVEDSHSGGSRLCVRLPRSPAPVQAIRASMPARSLVPSEAGRA